MESANAANRWVNTIDSKNPEILAQARRIIAHNIYCTLSTCSNDGYPWVSPVFFAYDQKLRLYWSSAIVAKHSQNLYDNNNRAAIAIFDSSASEGTGEGLYFYGVASELNSDCIEKVLPLLQNRANKQLKRTVKDYQNNSPRRIYQFQPQQVWVTSSRLAVGNQLVDTKIQLNLLSLLSSN
jgi:uncharacterized protein YhbP (UPF0306 family)